VRNDGFRGIREFISGRRENGAGGARGGHGS
jgi:hypothetical protein